MVSTALLKSRGWWALFVLSALFAWGQAWALPVEAEIKGDSFRWVSAQSSFGNNGVATSVWATPAQLVPASSYIPGGSVVPSLAVSMTGPGGSSVPLTLELLGMEYNSPEAVSMASVAGGGAAVSLSGTLVQVQGFGGGDQSITLAREVTPFTHARPVISLGDSATIVQAFSNANAQPGLYTSQVSIPLSYDYVRAGVRIRYNWTLPLSLTINYTPAILNDVTLTSPTGGVMTPRYTTNGGVKYAAGEAIYNGVATGNFSNGLRLRLKTGDSYAMTGPNNTSIPFSVNCLQCDQALLVNEGNMALPDLDTQGTRIPGVNVPRIDFTIGIQFADVELSTLQTGNYQGQFSLLFEPDV